jgi:hypothetical protein
MHDGSHGCGLKGFGKKKEDKAITGESIQFQRGALFF